MLKMPFYLIFFQSLPETALLLSLGMVLVGLKLKLKNILAVSLITAIVSYLVRSLPLAPGLHILIQLPVLISLTVRFYNLQLRFAALSAMLGLIGLCLVETALTPIISITTGIPLKEALADPLWRVIFPIPEYAFLLFLIIFLTRNKITVCNIDDLQDIRQVKSNE